jgi:uncharacterized protein with NRDE domain
MCLLAILHRVVDGCPVLVAANREEYYDRQGTPPQLWPGPPRFVAGKDPRAGGTWLGVNEHGVLVAITNRPKPPPPHARSRGTLCVELLACRSAEFAREQALDQLKRHPYAGCNVLSVDSDSAHVIHSGEKLEGISLAAGIHALSRGDVDDRRDPRIARALDWIEQLASRDGYSAGDLERWLKDLGAVCKDHGDERHPPICLHATVRGTVSSSIIALTNERRSSRWLHAQGAPCLNDYVDMSMLLQQVS